MIIFIYFFAGVKSDKICPDSEAFEDCVNQNLESLYERFNIFEFISPRNRSTVKFPIGDPK